MKIEKIKDTLLECYSKDLCYPKCNAVGIMIINILGCL